MANQEELNNKIIEIEYIKPADKEFRQVSDWLPTGKRFGIIAEFCIKPEFRRKGYGHKLAQKALEFFKAHGATEISAMVLKYNKPALKFWESLGFRLKMYELTLELH